MSDDAPNGTPVPPPGAVPGLNWMPPEPVSQVPSISSSGLASLTLGLGFLGFLTIGGLTQLASIPFGLWWCELFLFFGVPFVLLRLSGRAPFSSTGFTRPWVAGCTFGFALGVANFFAAVAPLQFVMQKVLPKSWLELYDATKVFADKSPLELAFIVGGVVIAAPLGEEVFFRGTVQRGWATRMGPVLSIIVTGAVFSAFHLDPIGFAARWELGMLFGLLAWRTGSLWPGIFAHLANNLTSTVLYFALKDEPQDPTEDVTAVLAIAGIGGMVLVGVLMAGLRFPSALKSPQPARDDAIQPAAGPLLPFGWLVAGLLSFATLLVADWRGSCVRAIDMLAAVKHPTEELKAQRAETLRGERSISDYFKARQAAK